MAQDMTEQILQELKLAEKRRDRLMKQKYRTLTDPRRKGGQFGQIQACQAIVDHLLAKGDTAITTASGVRKRLISLGVIKPNKQTGNEYKD